jgi:hypothetical protein
MSILIASTGDFLTKRASSIPSSNSTGWSSTVQQLSLQWSNPADVLSILLIIGGDVVQKALAQTSGGVITPVCFSFGWVAYSLRALVGVIGDGRLLPPPDYPAKVINLDSGYARENRNWVVGRLLRDNGITMSKKSPLEDKAIRIAIYAAQPRGKHSSRTAAGVAGVIGILVMIAQCVIAAVPIIVNNEWEIFLVTAVGTLLALSAGALPQWRAEKLPQRQQSDKNIALTSGNGSRDIMVIMGCGNSIDLEELASSETPRSNRVWERIEWLSKPVMEHGVPKRHSNKIPVRRIFAFWGIPVGFWLTLTMVSMQCIFWLALLISVAGIKSNTWYLLGVGLLGMFQNATVAGISRGPERRSLPLELAETIITNRVMDGLMDLEFVSPNFGRTLLNEFFPGKIRDDERDWWAGNRHEYDRKRVEENRGSPRCSMPNYINSRLSLTSLSKLNPRKSVSFGSDTFLPVRAISRPQSLVGQYPGIHRAETLRPKSLLSQPPTVASFSGRTGSISSEKQTFGATPPPIFSSPPSLHSNNRENLGDTSDLSGILPSYGIVGRDFSDENWKTSTNDTMKVNETNTASTASLEDLLNIAQSPSWA